MAGDACQGGLLVYHYLAGLLNDERSTKKEIVGFVPFACPHDGSDFALRIRKAVMRGNPQEKALRPGNDELADAVHNVSSNWPTVLRTPAQPVIALSDGVVDSDVAKGPWPQWDAVPGDHKTVLKPVDKRDPRYLVLRDAIVTAAPESAKSVSSAGVIEVEPDVNPGRDGRVPRLRLANESCMALARLMWPGPFQGASPTGIESPMLSRRGLICPTREPTTFVRLRVQPPLGRSRESKAALAVFTGNEVARTSATFTGEKSLRDLIDELSAGTSLGPGSSEPVLDSLTKMFDKLATAYETHTDLTSVANLGLAKSLFGEYLVTDDGITDPRDPSYQESIFTSPEESQFEPVDEREATDLERARSVFDRF